MLCNRARAQALMQREGIDALIAQHGINVYYLTDYWGEMMPALWDALYFALLPRDPARPAALIAAAMEMLFVDKTTWVPNRIYFSTADPAATVSDPNDEPPAIPFPGFPVRQDAALTPTEKTKLACVQRHGRTLAPSPMWALKRALNDAGLLRGRVVSDDARIEGWLAAVGLGGLEVQCRPEVFSEIRLVKTEAEIALMQQAAAINELALRHAARQINEDAEEEAVQRAYHEEMARRGGRGTYLVTSLGGLRHGRFVPGEPIMLDALGTFAHYHGDVGRTAVLGEPDAELLRRNRAVQAGFQAACEAVRPGMAMSQLAQRVADATRKAGFPDFLPPLPHNVGLQHTDDPAPAGTPPGFKPDRTIEAGMVINIDMPHEEYGWGSMHLEDTLRITADGCEPLTSLDMDLIVRR